MTSLATRETLGRKTRALSAISPKARKRQMRVVMLWFGAICAAFVCLLAAFGAAQAATPQQPAQNAIPTQRPPTNVITGPIRVAKDPLLCGISPSSESGFLSITIANSSHQVINKSRDVFYQVVAGRDQPLHAVSAPVLIPVGEQFSELVPDEGDVRPGPCVAWIFAPLEVPQLAPVGLPQTTQ